MLICEIQYLFWKHPFLFLFFSYSNVAKTLKCLEKKHASLSLHSHYTIKPHLSLLWLCLEHTRQYGCMTNSSWILRIPELSEWQENIPHLDISEFCMPWPQQYVCPRQIHSFLPLLLPLDNFKDKRQRWIKPNCTSFIHLQYNVMFTTNRTQHQHLLQQSRSMAFVCLFQKQWVDIKQTEGPLFSLARLPVQWERGWGTHSGLLSQP